MVAPSAILSLRGVPVGDLDLGRRQIALVEIEEDDAEEFVDLCLGLSDPERGTVHCLGAAWAAQSYRERLAHRSRIGSLLRAAVWPAHVPIGQFALMPRLYHGDLAVDEAVDQATVLARVFGLPGVPMQARETAHPGDLVRAACVRAFLGAPEFVVIADATVETMPELALPLAQAIATVQDRGGAVLWLLTSLGASAARFVKPDQVLRFAERGLVRLGRPR
jgi:phospholipid/cholesterol/gamma-HCH transport system ATP-binding protein